MSGRSPNVRLRLKEERERANIAISSITQAEILYGIEKRASPRLRSVVEELMGTIAVVSWDFVAAEVYGKLRAQLESAGRTLSGMDLLIAAHAVALRATLVTHDQAFGYVVPLLNVVDWATDL